MPPSLTRFLIFRVLSLRAVTVVPLQQALRRLGIVFSSGAVRTQRLADDAWLRGDAAAAMRYWRELEREQPSRAQWPLKIAQAARERGDYAMTESVLLAAQERGIQNEAIELALSRATRMLRRSNASLADAEAIVADPDASPDKLFHAAFYLMAQNQLDDARIGFRRLFSDTLYGPRTQGHLAAIEMLEEARARGRLDIPGWVSPAENSILVREPSSDTLVVGFALPSSALGLTLNAAHAMLSSNGVNALYLYDSNQIFHLAGTDRFGPGWQAMLDGIRALAAELGVRRIITLGGSASGYTAIRAALDLNADGALVFSPATLMLADANPEVSRNAHTLQRLRQYALPMMKDLRPLVRNRKSCPRIEIYYSASNRRDIMHAGNIADLPGVTLHPVDLHKRHDCLTEMAWRGYRDLLDVFPAP